MPRRPLRTSGAAEASLAPALRALRTELGVPDGFPAAVLDEAERAAAAPRPPGPAPADATGLPFFTVDPPGSADLDQAVHLSRRDAGGYRVHYAIADVAAFVAPGGTIDSEAHRRVQTLYFPDGSVPLHPPVLSAGAASLLPGETRPALLWRIDLDAEGRTVTAGVRRAYVRSRTRLDYATAQRRIDNGTAEEPLALLKEIGLLREALERERGGVSLAVPEQEIARRDGAYVLAFRAPLPAEGWNAQLSLLTGMAAADIMIGSGTGVLRTLPTAPLGEVARLRLTARALRIDWPHHVPYAEVIRSLDPRVPRHAAFLAECTSLLRGAGYTVFTGGRIPEPSVHAAVAHAYTHCTAPLRRLVDRYTGELCLAADAGQGVPEWVLSALEALPAEMAAGARRAGAVERECVDLVEAALLRDRVGDTFDGLVVDVKENDPSAGTVQLSDPAVVARIAGDGGLPLGEPLRVRLTRADPEARPGTAKVLFAPA
ncbi:MULTISPECIES: RNB domain-containing ribonuclease [Streptomyces]|uniref:RNB domain-containing ribonuclease n=1 Tax=Streptomyces tsukubensis (strain DSM 42081 / NBRC 108919 / NRRL 18488 / 9993) TaxID=1114943 RepID=I2MXI0_STRT9|nr:MULTISPECIES: RNB domain-containing ribonuclease [Streptomyces]AZK93856.1 ribonuclease II [Streptomyces tsukubensis]EIF89477.1 ribonuclease [Streptomyces tsukubensis NRRL18488]MYS65262.1 RNB domain-containing ribonuclease [Streptomyces sp. SID5473]QKM70013.1 RNB domain-containing ribonuclease [Streptomyces tsukubensis NRRL18488]TAI46008.1 RNB domain-containing ribonuclease [Streptomyces tsukubensis]